MANIYYLVMMTMITQSIFDWGKIMYFVLDNFLICYQRFFAFSFMRSWVYGIIALAFLATVPRLLKVLFFWR